jgi:hypothetical protein
MRVTWGIGEAAAFYEGEGYFGAKRNPYGHPTALRLTVAQRNEQPLQWFLNAVEVGRVQHRLIRGKDFWNYVAGKTANSLYVAKLIWPYLSDRRQDQIFDAIDEFLSVRHILQYDVSFFTEEVRAEAELQLITPAQVRKLHTRA